MSFLLLMTAFVLSFACQKESTAPSQTTPTEQSIAKNAVWRTPNGYVIPYSEKDHWQEYLQAAASEKVGNHYTSADCDPPGTSTCGLECVSSRKRGDCVRESACAPCVNCGCTPVNS